MTLLTQSVMIERRTAATALDAYGNTVDETAQAFAVRGYLEQTAFVEVAVGRETVTSDWLAVFPAGTTIAATDRVVYDGRTFEVVGAPLRAFNPRTRREQHVECRLTVTAR